jgi:lipid-binding SYLF domain-containing protein
MFQRNFLGTVLALIAAFLLAAPITAQQTKPATTAQEAKEGAKDAAKETKQEAKEAAKEAKQETKQATKDLKQSDEGERVTEAAKVLTEIMNIPEQSIPQELMDRAHGIAVIPHVVKGAFGVGGQWGKGVMSQRRSDGKWTAPSFIDIAGGSFGLQIGGQASDVVLVFTNDSGLKGILKGKMKLSGEAAATAGPVGRDFELGTDATLRSGIFSYSRSKGLFAGVSLDGSVISIDDSANHKVYGKEVKAEDILLANKVPANPVVAPFVSTLQKISPAPKRTSSK